MRDAEQVLRVKTRLTTVKGYAQLLQREIVREQPRTDRIGPQIDQLNREISRLVELVDLLESTLRQEQTQSLNGNGGSRPNA